MMLTRLMPVVTLSMFLLVNSFDGLYLMTCWWHQHQISSRHSLTT